MAKILNNAMGL